MCVVCRTIRPRAELIRLVRRPDGRIGWSQATGLACSNVSALGRSQPGGRGLHVCREGNCLTRLLQEKRFRRMFVDSMEGECITRLSALLPQPHDARTELKIEGLDGGE